MIRPAILAPRPSLLLLVLGGLVATLLLSALMFVAPAFGFPFLDFPRLVGGIVTDDPTVAFWLGYWIFFAVGVFVLAPLLVVVWTILPGRDVGFRGALVKGASWGLILWVPGGLLLPVVGLINQLGDQGLENPGFFALGAGLLGAVGFLLGHVAYGLTVALVGAMSQGIKPLETLGWMDQLRGDVRDIALTHPNRPGHQPRETLGKSSS